MEPLAILFVCMGNICRSPTAHGVFEQHVREAGLSNRIRVQSAGTVRHHVGDAPDPRTQRHARGRGYDLSTLRAQLLTTELLAEADYVLAMDAGNLAAIESVCPPEHRAKVRLFLDFAPQLDTDEVPDPYYGGPAGFERVLDLVEAGSQGLLAHLRATRTAA